LSASHDIYLDQLICQNVEIPLKLASLVAKQAAEDCCLKSHQRQQHHLMTIHECFIDCIPMQDNIVDEGEGSKGAARDSGDYECK